MSDKGGYRAARAAKKIVTILSDKKGKRVKIFWAMFSDWTPLENYFLG